MSASFEISLQDDVSPAAKNAAKGVASLSDEFNRLQKAQAAQERLANQVATGLKAQSDAIAEMQRKALAGHDADRDATFGKAKALQDEIAALQKANLARHDEQAAIDAGLQKMKEKHAADELAGKSAQQTAKWFGDLQAASKGADDDLLGFQTQLVGIAQKAAPVIAAITAIAVGLGKLAGMAIAATQEKDALREMFGGPTLDMLEEMSKRLPYTTDQLAHFATSLQAAGYSGERLRTAITAVAAAGARKAEWAEGADALLKRMKALEETGSKVKFDPKFEKQLFSAGINLGDVAAALGVSVEKLRTMNLTAQQAGDAIQKALVTKGQGALQQMGQKGEVLWAKIKEGINDAFEDLGDLVHPFMAEVQSLASEFFKGSIASGGLAGVVRSVLVPVFEVARRTVRAAHMAFLYLEIAWLKAKIAAKPLTDAMRGLNVSGGLVNVIMYLIAGTAITLAVVFGLLAAAVLLASLPFIVIGLAVYVVISAISSLIDLIGGAIDHFDDLKSYAAQAGQDLIDGLGNAIANGSAWVVGLITNLASSMIGAIKSTLGIASPSKVMMRMGAYTAQGLAEGIEAGQAGVQMAAAGAGGAAIGGAAAGASGGRAGGGGDVVINVEAGAVVIQGAGGDVKTLTREALALVLEEAALQAGIA